MRTPYTYLIGWPELDTWYYGVRYAIGCHPDELWVTYFTSSRHVAEFARTHGNPDIVLIRKIFEDTESARKWEHRVLRRLRVIEKDKWLNRTDNLSISPLYGMDNPSCKPENRQKISENTPRRYGDSNPMRNPDTAKKVSVKLKGRHNHWQVGENNQAKRPEVRKIISERQSGENNSFYNKKHTDETISKIKRKVTCPHCGKIGAIGIMKRWHFDNCKHK